jgi:zinc transport system ATP-binding protein
MGIELRNITFSYDQEPIIEEVSAQVNQAEFISIVGPNGGGKTTLLKLILGLLKPQHGVIQLDGKPINTQRHRIGYVPQTTNHDQRFPITVFDAVKTGLLSQNPFARHSQGNRLVTQALETVDMQHMAYRPFSSLSGGQRQRVLIARALAGNPEYLILDEPTSNVDIVINEQLHELLKRLSGEKTILLVTHDYALVSSLSDRVFCVNRHLHEHPVESVQDPDKRHLYGNRVAHVRHDIILNKDSCFCEEHQGGRA